MTHPKVLIYVYSWLWMDLERPKIDKRSTRLNGVLSVHVKDVAMYPTKIPRD